MGGACCCPPVAELAKYISNVDILFQVLQQSPREPWDQSTSWQPASPPRPEGEGQEEGSHPATPRPSVHPSVRHNVVSLLMSRCRWWSRSES